MKKSPLNRKKPINRISIKKKLELKETGDARKFYKDQCSSCECCGQRPVDDCHEIAAGAARHLAVRKPNLWLGVCRTCHEGLQGDSRARNLLLKIEAVIRDYNECCEGLGYVTLEDVLCEL